MNYKHKNIPIEKILLITIATVGILSMVAIAPAVGPALKLFGFGNKRYPQRYLQSAVGRLKEKGYIVFEEKNGKKFLRLTQKGKQQLRKYQYGENTLPKAKRWDKKWHIVIFDIPEKKRVLRNKVRDTLINFGFIKLQNSVWVYPYPCEEIITMLKADYKIGKNLLYIKVEKIEYDKPLKDFFSL